MSSEMKQSVKEYRKIWEEAGVEFLSSRPWTLTRATCSVAAPVPELKPTSRLFFSRATSEGKCRVLFVGEAEGFTEEASQLLGKIIDAMALGRETAPYFADEAETQIRESQPEVVVALGSFAAAALLGGKEEIPSLRGKWHTLSGAPPVAIRATFHPAHLLTTPAAKKEVWEDMKLILKKLGGVSK